MAAPINTNVASLNSQRALSSSNESLATSLKRLSSGLRINSAKDDAAGLAISQRMSSQINGLNQATRNANDGISLAQTAEGGLSSIGESLQRMRTLAVQASNATNSAEDRAALQKEVDQLVEQINTVASQTSFNGIKLLDGTFTQQTFQVGANKGESIDISSIASAKADALGVGTTSTYTTKGLEGTVSNGTISSGGVTVNGYGIGPSNSDGVSSSVSITSDVGTGVVTAGDLKINGVAIGAGTDQATLIAAINAKTAETGVTALADGANFRLTSTGGKDINLEFSGTATATTVGFEEGTYKVGSDSAIAKAAAFNAVSGQTGVSATVTSTVRAGTAVTAATADVGITAGDIKINGVDIGAVAGGATADAAGGIEKGANLAAAINAKTAQTGVTASFSTTDGAVTLTAADGRTISAEIKGTGAASGLGAVTTTLTQNTYGGIKLSSNSSAGITLGGTDLAKTALTAGYTAAEATFGAGLAKVDISTASGAADALATIDAALQNVNSSRASLGAIQNRFESVVSNLQTSAENITASRSRILDADFAAETANLSRAQVLQQAGTAMLAQANALPQNVLSLLR